MPEPSSYDYAVIQVTPHVDRSEFINAGVILFCRTRQFLAAKVHLDADRLAALAPDIDLAAVRAHLDLMAQLCHGQGPIGRLGQAETFHWLVSPRSTVIQCSAVHSGLTDDPAATLDELLDAMVCPWSSRQGNRT